LNVYFVLICLFVLCVEQTHTTPVLLGFMDRAELAASEYKSIPSIVEGVVIVEKLPEPAEAV
jgi:hypothetical protein